MPAGWPGQWRLDDDGDLVVRAESRLSSTGFVDESTDELVSGNGTNWLLAAPNRKGRQSLWAIWTASGRR